MRTFTPYRICPLGAHVDHQHGMVTGFALDKGVTLEYTESEAPDTVRLTSLNFPGEVVFATGRLPKRTGDWGDYARAALAALLEGGYDIKKGFTGRIEGTLPIGGLSSSASVIITYLTTFCKLNGIHLSGWEMIRLSQWAENHFLGLSVGILDPGCEIFAKKDRLLFLDTRTNHVELIPQNSRVKPYQVAVFFSGKERSLVNSSYNARVDECKSAAFCLKAYNQEEGGRWADTRLVDVEEPVFRKYGNRLPESFRKRAEHFYGEQRRVEQGVAAWRAGDIEAFGRLVFESGSSSIELYESGSPELQVMHEIALTIPGIYGGRFSGAGFKGCYLAFIDPGEVESITAAMEERYLARFPEMRGRYGYHLCATADGAAMP